MERTEENQKNETWLFRKFRNSAHVDELTMKGVEKGGVFEQQEEKTKQKSIEKRETRDASEQSR